MDIKLVKVEVEDKEILKNLLEKYDYEFSQWDNRDVNKLGLYGYNYLDNYWTEDNRWAFFIKVDEKLGGFVMINSYQEAEETDYSMAEFFVMYKYRRNGVGKYAAIKTFDMFHGKWQLKRHPKNTASVYFWNKVIAEYTKGDYRLVEGYPNSEYDDGTLGDMFFFDNSFSKA
jgi:predicted acetyltransferase